MTIASPEVVKFLEHFQVRIDDQDEDILEHFGVLGMKWGVRRSEKTGGTASGKGEKTSVLSKFGARNLEINKARQANFKAVAAKSGIRISEIDSQIAAIPKGYSYKRNTLKNERALTVQQRDQALKKAQKTPTTGLTSTQKKLLIGAGVAAVLVGAVVASKYYDGEGMGAAIRRGQSQREFGSIFKLNKDLTGEMTHEQLLANVVKGINPNYGTQGGTMNCRRATFAYEMRRRGFDVNATTSPFGYGQSESGLVNALVKGDRNLLSARSMSSYASSHSPGPLGVRTRGVRGDKRTHDAFQETVSDIRKLRESFDKHPDGARGEAVFDMGGFAHSMQWERIKGVTHIFDAQKGQHFDTDTAGLNKLMSKWGSPSATHITRLDNVDLDYKFISRWVTNNGPRTAGAPIGQTVAQQRVVARAAQRTAATASADRLANVMAQVRLT